MRQSITVSVIQKQKRQKWIASEDALLFQLIMDKHGLNWTAVAEDMPMRTGKQCRER
jgi:predicted RNA-binding protein (virulence factor B family)